MFAIASHDKREQAAVLALTEASPGPWYQVASVVEDAGSALAVAGGEHTFYDESQAIIAVKLAERVTDEMIDHWAKIIDKTLDGKPDTRLITVLDGDYPGNLRRVYDRPPFLFLRGTLSEDDARSVAISRYSPRLRGRTSPRS